MDERHFQVLAGLVREYVHSAQPVGSEALGRSLKLDLSAASIRTILRQLDEAGYLEQPHTSAGRIPTDKGYRYFIDHTRPTAVGPSETRRIAEELTALEAEYQHLARATSKLLARLSHMIAISSWLQQREVQEAGLQEVLHQPEGESVSAVREMSVAIEGVDAYLPQIAQEEQGTHVFVGQENPFFPAEHTSLVVRSAKVVGGEKIVLVLVGPKRMQYHRNMALVDTLARVIENYY